LIVAVDWSGRVDGAARHIWLADKRGRLECGRDREALAWSRAHERVHVKQAERWGPLFLPAYGVGSIIALLRGGRAYRDNPFEKEAYDLAG